MAPANLPTWPIAVTRAGRVVRVDVAVRPAPGPFERLRPEDAAGDTGPDIDTTALVDDGALRDFLVALVEGIDADHVPARIIDARLDLLKTRLRELGASVRADQAAVTIDG